jgi:phosphoribosylformylglycinamidine synthase subunit PurL
MAISTHAFHHHLQYDPQKATEILISRAARKMLCMGTKPVAISAFLYHINFADPNGQYIASGAKADWKMLPKSLILKFQIKKSDLTILPVMARCHQRL